MISALRKQSQVLIITLILTCLPTVLLAQATVFSEDFTTSRGTGYTTANGAIGSSPTWSLSRGGTDFGGRINSGILSLTNDATGAYNNSGWVLASTNTSTFAAPYSPILNMNAGQVTWTFNMRQTRSNPSGPASGYYANAFILAGTSGTTATTGSGYAIIYGQYGTTDPIRLVRYTAGLRTSTNVLTTINTSSDIGNQYLSVKVVYTPSNNTWQLYARIDGTTSFQDPEVGNLTLVGSGSNSTSTGTSLPLMGAFWNAGTRTGQTASFDNIKVTVAVPAITSISPTSKVANTGAFTLNVYGTDFSPSTIIRWNGSNRTTTYVSATQLSAAIPASDITAAGTASITAATGTAVSNAQVFTIDPPATPSISPSTTALARLTTVTGTASGTQSFTVTAANLTTDVTVAAPANFEVSRSATTGFADTILLPQTAGTLTGQPVTVYVRLKAVATPGLYSSNITLSTPGGASKLVAVTGTVLSTEPTTQATSATFTNVTSISFTVNAVAGNGTNRLILIRAGSAVTAAPVDGVTYTASTVFGSGSEIGTGNYVIYASTGNSVTVTGLSPATTYHVAVYDYNGAAGTQNYRIATPAIANRATLNAPVGLQIAALNSLNTITFDATVEGVNTGVFDGGGVNPVAGSGELSSSAWSFSGFSNNVAFGGSSAEDSSLENGASEGSVTEGGIYAFEVSPDNFALGIQPEAGEFAPGAITLRFQNQTISTINSISVGYKVYVRNDEAGSSSLNLSYSSDNAAYTAATAINLTTTAAADAVPGWKAYYKVITITGLNISANNYGYLRWSGATVSGTVFDEIAIDDIAIVANPSTTYASFSAGTAETFTVAGNTSLTGNVTVTDNLNFISGKASIGNYTLTLNGTVTNGVAGGLTGSASSSIMLRGTANTTLSFDQTIPGTTNALSNFSVRTTAANTITIGNALAVNGTLRVDEFQTLNMGTSTLSGALATILNNGTITSQNVGTEPFTPGKTWTGFGTLILNAATAPQTLVSGTYNNNVTITTTGGAVATGNVTVTAQLNLPNANPSATLGSLHTGSNTLTMGPEAVNLGIGDVSGIIRRDAIVVNKLYTFGHPETSILFPAVGTLPTSLSIKTILGSAPAGKPDAILRTYDLIRTGGSGTKAVIRAHYLDSELNGNTEDMLVDWVVQVSPFALMEQSRTNYSTTENFVSLANIDVAFFDTAFGSKLLTMANSQVATSVWNGADSDVWIHANNWTPAAVPNATTQVIIPAVTTNNPTLNINVEIKTLTIEEGAVVNSPDDAQLIINGDTGAWINMGTFNPGTGTSAVIFTNTYDDPSTTLDNLNNVTMAGSTTFNNITVGAGAILRPLGDNYMSIAKVFTNNGSFIPGALHNTVEYTGTNQTVVVPNGTSPAYHDLIINGSGAVLPATLSINGDLITNQFVNFAGKTITMSGVDVEDQMIGGTVSPQFNNLILNKPTGTVALAANVGVTGTLTLTAGILDIENFDLTLGTNAIAGTFSATSMIEADGTGVVRKAYSGPGSYIFPVGEGTSNTSYSPITVNVTSGTFNNAYVAVNVIDAIHPSNAGTARYLTRYWNVTQTGITNALATITATYITGDAVGGQATLAAAQLNGSFNAVTNPWIKFSPLAANTLTATNAVLTSGQRSSFTGITAQSLAVTIDGGGSFCQGDVVTLTANVSAGDPPYTFEWSDGLGNGPTATLPTTMTGSKTYTLTVRDVNGIAATNTVDVTVSEAPIPGVLSGGQTICANSPVQAITLSGNTGTVVRWERATSIAFTGVTFINNTTNTLSTAEIGTFATTRYIRAVIQNGSCPVVYTEPVQILIQSTTWDGTAWSNSLPTASTSVIFTGNYTATGNIDACSIVVNNGAVVNIPSGNTVTINGALTVTSGSFTLENNANLIQLTNAVNTGNIVVKRNSSSLYRLDYTAWSSPVSGPQTLQQFSPETSATRFYTYNTVTDMYSAVSAAATFAAGRGYHIRMPNGDTTPGYNAGTAPLMFKGIFTGVPNNGPVTTTLTDAGNGYSLVGNPYPSPLNVSAFLAANANALDGTIWIWRKRNNPNSITSAYVTINSTGQYVGNGELEQENPNGVVRTGQGFIVRLRDGNSTNDVTFNNAMRSNDVSDQFFRMSASTAATTTTGALPESHGVWLNLTNAGGFFSQMYTGYIAGATTGEDNGIDAKYINDSPTVLASAINAKEYIIQGRPLPFMATDVVPLIFRTAVAGTYSIAIDHVDGLFTAGQQVYLKDNLTGTVHNLTAGNYSFSTETGTFSNRFEIVYTDSALGTDEPVLTANEVIVYKQDKALYITTGTSLMDEVSIYDIRGRMIYTSKDINATTFKIDNLQAEEQVLIVNIATEHGTVSKKVIY
jgi:hypothetical protein